MTPRIAIVIPAYQAAETIAETLDSILACLNQELVSTVLICDDASTDETATCVMPWLVADGRFRLHRSPRNVGERTIINSALKSIGNDHDWALILHSDDVVKPNWLELYFEQIAVAHSSTASICSSYDCWYAESGEIEPGEENPARQPELIEGTRDAITNTLRRGCWWHISGCAIRLSTFDAIGPFNPAMPQLGDFEWLLRCLRKGYSVEYIPRSTMFYRLHKRSVSTNSFAMGRDLRERLCIMAAYRRLGYIGDTHWLVIRSRVLGDALRRTARGLWTRQVRHLPRLAQTALWALFLPASRLESLGGA